ncbi:MAG: bifunctional diaminohydroxyphosphoribosylaminopyrimidine deaminase/5-amino-6-(5-phosphoribosylamino)uracil reductase RibD, partial [Planctomycetota bacterium]|nr:bifunctional diaminohydroxyphosphoribosylaminopyrimidine deaminase/5-amino-6-(5-phosphoribosylamino)uracil reductase RibD [Planctomycetota bacterium]
MPASFPDDRSVMLHAVSLAKRGIGAVEPNPAVGAVIVDAARNLLGEGFHRKFGGPHAEVEALTDAVESARGASLFVTLEPCSHHGKTPPCVAAILDAGIKRVVVGSIDPAEHASGRGIEQLRTAGVDVEVGLEQQTTDRLIAPFRKLVTTGLPYVHAKWAMSLDGKIATRTGDSQWISNTESRAIVHELRSRMDAIIVGSRTAELDDPTLTARLPHDRAPLRSALRIVVDGAARLSPNSNLCRTVADCPVLVATLNSAPESNVKELEAVGVAVLRFPADASNRVDIQALLAELGRRQLTNVLI